VGSDINTLVRQAYLDANMDMFYGKEDTMRKEMDCNIENGSCKIGEINIDNVNKCNITKIILKNAMKSVKPSCLRDFEIEIPKVKFDDI